MLQRKSINLLTILILATAVFFANQLLFEGSLNSKELLGKEIQAPAGNLSDWGIIQKAPFKYRIVFPFLVSSVSDFVSATGLTSADNFYFAYYLISYLCVLFATLGMFFLLKASFKDYKIVVIGSLVYIVSVPFAFAYTVPVHTREDFLAFALFNWALWAIVKKRDLLFVLFAVAGVLTRETLMLLPLLRLFFGVGSTFKTLAVSFIPVATWFALRIHMGMDEYDKWLGLNWNISNVEQVLVFGYLSFSFLWLLAFKGFKERIPRFFLKQEAQRLFNRKSFLTGFILIFSTTFFFGIYNELRLLFLFAPFMIVYGVSYFKYDPQLLTKFIKSRSTWIYFVLLSIVSVLILFYADSLTNSLHPINKYDIPYIQWYIVFLCYLWPTISLLTLLVKKTAPEMNENEKALQ